MDEERQTGNTGRPSAKTESKGEGKSAHAEKLKTEKSSSAATKSKFGKGGKKGENGQKLKGKSDLKSQFPHLRLRAQKTSMDMISKKPMTYRKR